MLPLLRTVIMPIAISMLLFGCVTAGSKLESSRPETKLPAWVLNPDKPGYESVIGSAAKQDWGGHAAQYRVAMMKARQEMAQRIRVRGEVYLASNYDVNLCTDDFGHLRAQRIADDRLDIGSDGCLILCVTNHALVREYLVRQGCLYLTTQHFLAQLEILNFSQ